MCSSLKSILLVWLWKLPYAISRSITSSDLLGRATDKMVVDAIEESDLTIARGPGGEKVQWWSCIYTLFGSQQANPLLSLSSIRSIKRNSHMWANKFMNYPLKNCVQHIKVYVLTNL